MMASWDGLPHMQVLNGSFRLAAAGGRNNSIYCAVNWLVTDQRVFTILYGVKTASESTLQQSPRRLRSINDSKWLKFEANINIFRISVSTTQTATPSNSLLEKKKEIV
jgi:hypothetical protein